MYGEESEQVWKFLLKLKLKKKEKKKKKTDLFITTLINISNKQDASIGAVLEKKEKAKDRTHSRERKQKTKQFEYFLKNKYRFLFCCWG